MCWIQFKAQPLSYMHKIWKHQPCLVFEHLSEYLTGTIMSQYHFFKKKTLKIAACSVY